MTHTPHRTVEAEERYICQTMTGKSFVWLAGNADEAVLSRCRMDAESKQDGRPAEKMRTVCNKGTRQICVAEIWAV